jgi:hypothetical protein
MRRACQAAKRPPATASSRAAMRNAVSMARRPSRTASTAPEASAS